MTTKNRITSDAPTSTSTRAREALAGGWGVEARRFTRDNPTVVLVGAFALGVLLARVVRHA